MHTTTLFKEMTLEEKLAWL